MLKGEMVGNYELTESVLFKTMHQGEVWVAKKEDAAGLVELFALKFIPISKLALDDKQLQELKAEARLWHKASKGHHENIVEYVETIEYETQDDEKYLVVVSEYAHDGSLQLRIEDRKNKNAQFTSQEIKSILGGILSGLEHVHSKEIFHRDLKPANVVFDGETPKIIDFGISRLFNPEHSQVAAGTPYYMAPEAFDGERDVTVDIWSVGVMFYYMVVGRLPFAPKSGVYEIIRRAVNREDYDPLPENIPAEYKEVIDKSLDKVPTKRFRSAAEMREAIEKLPSLPTDPPELKTDEGEISVITVESKAKQEEAVATPQLNAGEETSAPPLDSEETVEAQAPEESVQGEAEGAHEVQREETGISQPPFTWRRLTSNPLLLIGALGAAVLLIGAIWYADKNYPTGTEGNQTQNGSAGTASGERPIKIKLATSWKDLPILSDSISKMAKEIQDASNGEVEIQVLQAGEATDRTNNKIDPLKLFAAVSRGDVQMAHTASYYHADIPGAVFFSAVPFGMNAEQMKYWLTRKDGTNGMGLWKDLYGEKGVVPFACGNTGQQYGGWFDKQINEIADFEGIKMRIPGLGGKVLALQGVRPIELPAGQILDAANRGDIDAAEWIGPYHDYILRLYSVFNHYYETGWQEPNTMFELIINKEIYDKFSPQLKEIIASKTREYNDSILTEFNGKNAEYRGKLQREKSVKILRFSRAITSKLRSDTQIVLEEHIRDDEKSRRIYESYKRTQEEFERNRPPTY